MARREGQKIGRFEILKFLGKGNFGEVYLAKDPRLEREVAIKLILSNLLQSDDAKETQEVIRRFEVEAKAAAGLNHPNTVTVYEFGEDGGDFFIVMEYVDGKSLKELMSDKALTRPELLEVLAQVCDGLEVAHEKGIIHRDIKPANMMLTKGGKRMLAKVLDFGVARLVVQGTMGSGSGSLIGTLDYMAPEYLKTGVPDKRGDLFAVGVILYEFLSGKKPFSGPTGTLIASIMTEPHVPIDIGSLRDISPDVLMVMDRALEKNPDKRYQTGEELARDLRAAKDPVWRKENKENKGAQGGKRTAAPEYEDSAHRGSVQLKTIKLNKNSMILKAGLYERLEATVFAGKTRANDQSVIWSSNANSVATVNRDGHVRARAGGEATITATTPDGEYAASCEVSVKAPFLLPRAPMIAVAVAAISVLGIYLITGQKSTEGGSSGQTGQQDVLRVTLSPPSWTLDVNEHRRLEATVWQGDVKAENQEVTWEIKPADSAKIEDDLVTALIPGTVNITATPKGGGNSGTCTLTVKEQPPPPARVVIDNPPSNSLIVGNSVQFTATVWQGDVKAENQKVTWTVRPEGNATVESLGSGWIVPLAGPLTIIATPHIDGEPGERKVNVVGGSKEGTPPTPPRVTKVTRVDVNGPYSLHFAGDSIQFSAEVWQGNVKAENQKVTWTVEPKGNVTVGYNDGLITPHLEGQFTITATSVIDGKSGSRQLTVKSRPGGSTTNKKSPQVTYVGEWNSDPNDIWQYKVKPRLVGMGWTTGKIVTVRVTIGEDGVPASANLISGDGRLRKIAEESAFKWRFRKNLPKYTRDGYEIEINF